MSTSIRLCAVAVLFAVSVPAFAAESVIAEGHAIEKLSDGFAFTEGPASDAAGNVYFTDQPNNRIHIWSVEGKLSTFMEPCGRSNGLCFDKDGYLWACADDKNQLWRIDVKDKTNVVYEKFHGKLLNAPNDVWVAPDGSAYFSDPFYKRDYWQRGPSEQDCEAVYRLDAKTKKITRVADDLKQPNGLIGTPDGKTLYVADIGDKKTYSYTIQSDGTLTDRRLFCEMGSDGMTIDNEGNVYLTGDGVFVFDSSGKQIAHIPVDAPWTANVCFGGKDRNELFITASTALFRIKLRTKGVGSQ
ncbi:MAG: SMP-30/gluconolactonase/LRE family protein [Candidatus Hydrogenedentes bacterium]|nr:SMP-30/gluconolactonase/LRE family protein [Candidatus Hydrogenedentota bacterium]